MLATDQSHLRKYLATLGVSIVAGVVSLTALALRLPGDLLVKQSDLANLTPVARETIARRQNLVNALMHVLPWFLVVGVLLGIITTLYGLAGWARRQRVADEYEDESLGKLRHEVRQLTADEQRAKQESEAAKAVTDPQSDVTSVPLERVRQRVALIEAEFAARLAAVFGRERVQTGVRVHGPDGEFADVDAIVHSRREDYLFEVKYSTSEANLAKRIREGVETMTRALRITNAQRAVIIAVIGGEQRRDVPPVLTRRTETASGVPVETYAIQEDEFLDMAPDRFAEVLRL